MSLQNAKNFSVTVPMFIALFFVQDGSGVAQIIFAIVGALATTGFVHFAAHFVWTPFLRTAGFWWSAVFLGCAIVSVGLAAAVARIKLGDPRGVWTLLMSAAIGGLLFGWVLAALRGAEDQKLPNQYNPRSHHRPLPCVADVNVRRSA